MPSIRQILHASQYTAMLILEINDNVMEKAVVWMVRALEKWLTVKAWPGTVRWPPDMPDSCKPLKLSFPDAENDIEI